MENKLPSHAWIRFFCGKDQRGRVAIFTRVGQEWQLSSVGAEVPQQLQAGRLPVAGRFGISAEYKGCPRCRSNSYVRCGELSCWDSSLRYFTCGNCGARCTVRSSPSTRWTPDRPGPGGPPC